MKNPRVHAQYVDAWQMPDWRRAAMAGYESGRHSFVPGLLPELAVRLSVAETLELLAARVGAATVTLALAPKNVDPAHGHRALPSALASPVAQARHAGWLRTANLVAVNVRTVGNFFNLVKYALTLPALQHAIHILPIWETGVVDSLYGMSSWEINPEFFSAELMAAQPALDTVERQLKACVNLLHATGRTVGIDVIPHTDRFSEMALCFPHFYEWLQREETTIVDHRAELHEDVQQCIFEFLQAHGPACAAATDGDAQSFFRDDEDKLVEVEARRRRALFGERHDVGGRLARRIALIKHLSRYGYEPVPATMSPPYRGIEVDPSPSALRVDSHGLCWRDYRVTAPEPMSRVFGPLASYKLHERLDDNANWQIDFTRPRQAVFRYVCEHYRDAQTRFGFDFMRGDMSHVQMRSDGVPAVIEPYYDLLCEVKRHIAAHGAPYFGYFAEGFLAPAGTMAYGDEVDHLEAAEADATLGDLQSTVVGSAEFLRLLRRYLDLAATRAVAPSLTMMTADKDDPRFDPFYVSGSGNVLRMFVGLFVADLPSYMALGFECRDVHVTPAPNEHYTKLFVFHETEGPKATAGPFVWGRNGALFHELTRLREYADGIATELAGHPTRWLILPDPALEPKVMAWTQVVAQPKLLFVINFDLTRPVENVSIPTIPGANQHPLVLDYSTESATARIVPADQRIAHNGFHYRLARLGPGEARAYRLE